MAMFVIKLFLTLNYHRTFITKRFLCVGATKFSEGVVKGAEVTGRAIQKGGAKIRDRITPEETPSDVSPHVTRGLDVARKATGGAVRVSQFLGKNVQIKDRNGKHSQSGLSLLYNCSQWSGHSGWTRGRKGGASCEETWQQTGPRVTEEGQRGPGLQHGWSQVCGSQQFTGYFSSIDIMGIPWLPIKCYIFCSFSTIIKTNAG